MELDNLPNTPEARAAMQKWLQEESTQPQQEVEEQVTQEAEQQIEKPVEQIAEQPKADPVEEDLGARNFRALADAKKRIERERDEALKRLKELEYIAQQKQPVSPSVEEDDDILIGADEIAEGKHLSKVTKKIKNLEQQLRNYQNMSAEVTAEARLKSQYQDFDSVVSRENIELLRDMYPELAQTLHHNPDIYSKAVSTYTMIKNLGIHKTHEYTMDKAVAQKNASKPKPLASVSPQQGDSPLQRANAFANGLTPELQKQLREEMYAARKAM